MVHKALKRSGEQGYVALKLCRRAMEEPRHGQELEPDASCFLQECALFMEGVLDHPSIVGCKGAGVAIEGDGLYGFIALELIEGEDLRLRLRRGTPIRHAQVVRWASELAEALLHLHGRRVIHRDLKPSNLMISRSDGSLKLIDFGSLAGHWSSPSQG